MPDVHRLPDKNSTLHAATQWLARLNADDVSSTDWQQFEAWRNAHPLHARTYEELAVTWNALRAAGPEMQTISVTDEMKAIAAAPKPRRLTRWLAAAAAIGFVCIGGWYAMLRAPEVQYQTAVGQYSVMRLADGSMLELNTNSVARVEYSHRSRIIHLDRGQAFFQVAHDGTRPFWVIADGSWVRAVGTAFDVHRDDSGVQVTVSEGVVKVGHTDGSAPDAAALERSDATVLFAGQQAHVSAGRTDVQPVSGDQLSRMVAWRGGTLIFDDEPLSTVVAEISRYTTVKLVLEDAALREIRIGGTFKASNEGVESFLTMLHDGLGLRVRRENDRVRIERGDDRSR